MDKKPLGLKNNFNHLTLKKPKLNLGEKKPSKVEVVFDKNPSSKPFSKPSLKPAANPRKYKKISQGSKKKQKIIFIDTFKKRFKNKDYIIKTYDFLLNQFPKTFNEYVLPLKIKIREDILTYIEHAKKELNLDFYPSEDDLKRFLALYTVQRKYAVSIAQGKFRFDLEGKKTDLEKDSKKIYYDRLPANNVGKNKKCKYE